MVEKIDNGIFPMEHVDCLCSNCYEAWSFVSVKFNYSFNEEYPEEWIDLCADCISIIIKEMDLINEQYRECDDVFLLNMEVEVI